MSVRDFMSTNLVTAKADTPIFDAVDLMKQHGIHRLPVVENERLIGLITEGTIASATPSKATSLSVYEMNYLLNKTTVGDVMIKNVTAINPDALLEDAISLMRQRNIGVLPVLENNQLVGIITNNDIFDAFLKITGYNSGSTRITLEITEDHAGILAEIAKLLADNQLSILTIVVNRLPKATFVELQIETQEVEKVRTLLTEAGYLVIGAVLTNQN